ncbi:MAG: BrnT family toxin [bacterium]|nr:BrnT family toxin [bacterium]
MGFEWDNRKRHQNLHKHGLDFADAVFVFDDVYRIERFDKWFLYSECRYQTIGCIAGRFVVFVVWTQRGRDRRIISARLAHRKERNLYYER